MRLAGRALVFGERTLVMAVLNCTPDSFSGDGLGDNVDAAVAQAQRFLDEGADLLDIGGESTRPGAQPVGGQAEIDRVCPVIEAIRQVSAVPISIDTRHAVVAEAALLAGANLVNDVSGLTFDPRMADVLAGFDVPVVVQHAQGTPETMQDDPRYEDVVEDVIAGLRRRLRFAVNHGIARERCIVDPGLGFGKTLAHNLRLLRRLSELRRLGRPILVGTSRKRFIGTILQAEVDDRLEGTAATVALAIANGADIVRVHDVRAMGRVARMADAVVRGWLPAELAEQAERSERGGR